MNATTTAPGSEFPFVLDINAGDMVGIGAFEAIMRFSPPLNIVLAFMQSNIQNGTHVNAATAFLEPVLSRPNLDVLIQNQATRVISNGTTNGKIQFNQVELAQNSTGTSQKSLHLSDDLTEPVLNP